MKKHALVLFAGLCLLAAGVAGARTRLVALPDREATMIRLDNPGATLVQEERVLTLQRGTNRIDFSWEGVRIDPQSVRLTMLGGESSSKVNLLSVSYPPGGSSLVWKVYSESAVQQRARVTYLLQGLDRLITHRAVATQDESSLKLQSRAVLRNYSGEDYAEAKCLLGYGRSFTVGLEHRETRRVTFSEASAVPVTKKFTWDAAKQPHDPEKADQRAGIPVSYVVRNSTESGLGQGPILPGKVRLFQADGTDSTVLLGEERASFTPVGSKVELSAGRSRDLTVTQRRMSSERVNRRRDDAGNLEVYDRLVEDRVIIENHRDTKTSLTIVEHIPGEWEVVDFSHNYTKKNHSTLEFEVTVPAGEKVTMNLRYRRLDIFASRFEKLNTPRR